MKRRTFVEIAVGIAVLCSAAFPQTRTIPWYATDATAAGPSIRGTVGVYTSSGQSAVGQSMTGTRQLQSGFLCTVAIASIGPRIAVDDPVDFGSVLVGLYGEKTVDVRNTGDEELRISSITISAGDFTLMSGGGPLTIPKQQSAQIVIRFSPASAGSKSGTLTITSNASNGSTRNVLLTGNGLAQNAPDLVLSDHAIDFGNVLVGTTPARRVTVTNNGTAALTIANLAITGAAEYSMLHPCAASLPPGGSDYIEVQFSPSVAGPRGGSITFNTNDLPENATVSITMTGMGVTTGVPKITVSAASVDFGSTAPNVPVTRDVTVSNTGTGDLILGTQTATPAAFTVAAASSPLAPGRTGTARLTFTPTAVGNYTGTFTITSNDPSAPTTNVSLTGKCETPTNQPRISLSTEFVDFGTVMYPERKTASIDVTNVGGVSLSITGVTASPAQFFVSRSPGPIIAAGTKSTCEVVFEPANANGPVSGTLIITSNDPVRGSITVQLRGNQQTDVERIGEAPATAWIGQNSPNPFTSATTIRYGLAAYSRVTVTVHDMYGRRVATIVDATQQPGSYAVSFNASSLPAGTYICRLETAAGMSLVRSMSVIR